jgi:hypothetical protein
MLLRVDTETKIASRQRGVRLKEFALDERGLQDILFRSLDRLIPEDELLLVMQSRQWQEEPDIMALGADGTLFIFELKAWESRSENLLQVLRYGQIYGQYSYRQLDAVFRSFMVRDASLKETHHSTFDLELAEEAKAAEILGVSQSRISDLIRGKWEKFSLEMLITLATRAGMHVTLKKAA